MHQGRRKVRVIVTAANGGVSHIIPLVPIAEILVAWGHDVSFAVPEPLAGTTRATDLPTDVVPTHLALDALGGDVRVLIGPRRWFGERVLDATTIVLQPPVGPVGAAPEWLDAPDLGPLVYVTFGSMFRPNSDLLRSFAAAAASHRRSSDIAAALHVLLTDPRYRAAARAVKDELAVQPEFEAVVPLIEAAHDRATGRAAATSPVSGEESS